MKKFNFEFTLREVVVWGLLALLGIGEVVQFSGLSKFRAETKYNIEQIVRYITSQR